MQTGSCFSGILKLSKIGVILNPFMLNGLFYLYSSNQPTSSIRGVWLVFIILCLTEIPVFNANSVDPDQAPSSVASDLGLHCQCPFYGMLGLNGLIERICS